MAVDGKVVVVQPCCSWLSLDSGTAQSALPLKHGAIEGLVKVMLWCDRVLVFLHGWNTELELVHWLVHYFSSFEHFPF